MVIDLKCVSEGNEYIDSLKEFNRFRGCNEHAPTPLIRPTIKQAKFELDIVHRVLIECGFIMTSGTALHRTYKKED